MAKSKIPATPAIRMLKAHRVDFTLHPYVYEEKSGAMEAAEELGVPARHVVKTLVMEDQDKKPFLILMHGGLKVSTKTLARTLGAKTIAPCSPGDAHKHTGYMVGGVSPFGTKKALPVYVEAGVFDLPKIYINAGKRGLLASMPPNVLTELLNAQAVNAAVD